MNMETEAPMIIDPTDPSEARRLETIQNLMEEIEGYEAESAFASTKIKEATLAMTHAEQEQMPPLELIRDQWIAKRIKIAEFMENAANLLHQLKRKDRERSQAKREEREKQKSHDSRLQTLLKARPSKLFMKENGNPEDFIKSFMEFIETRIPDKESRKDFIVPILADSLKDDPKHSVFIKKLDADKIEYWDLSILKREYLNHFAGQSWQASLAGQLANIAMGFEQPADYISRIIRTTSQLGIRADQPMDDGLRIILKGWYYQLPHNIQLMMASQMEVIYRRGTIQMYLDAIQKHVPQKPDRIESCPLYCPYCPSKVDYSCNCPTMRRLHSKRLSKDKGSFEKKLKNDFAPGTPVESSGRSNEPSGKKCFRCQEPNWTRDHRCKKGKEKSISSAVITCPTNTEIPEVLGEWERYSLDRELEGGAYVSTAFTPSENKVIFRPKISLFLNGSHINNLYVDTMSDFSLITPGLYAKIASNPATNLNQVNLPNLRAANGKALNLVGKVDIKIERGIHKLIHPFLISSDLPSPIEGLLGNDVLSLLGISLTGLDEPGKGLEGVKESVVASVVETTEHSKGNDLGLTLGEAISRIELADKNASDYSHVLFTYRARLQEEIKPLLLINEQLKGFCTHSAAEIKFKTTDEIPVNVRQYELPFVHRPTVDKQIQTWLEEGVIEPCESNDHYNNPVLVVPKFMITGQIKGWRTCIDPRQINAKIIDSTYPLPLARDIFDRLAGCVIYTVIDLKSGFNQIIISFPDRKKTAFTWNKKVYQFVGAPFGFKTIPQDFQRLMDKIFQDLDCTVIYIDDIIVASHTFADHVRHVTEVIERLNKFNLKLSVSKMVLAVPEVIVIGNRVSKEGVTVAVEKLEKMEYWKGPVKTLKQLQQRLGFTNYFREYCPMYSKLMAPLESLRSKDSKIVWLPEHDRILDQFKKILSQQIMIQFPDFSQPLIVGTDASKYGLGAVLYQVDGAQDLNDPVELIIKKPKRYIRFASRSLSGSERNYGAPQRELLGVLFALRSFRAYLYGRRFRLLTDHQALTYMLNRPKVSSVIMNWLDEILLFNFKIEHLPGIKNILPDAISRIYDFDDREPDIKVTLMTVEDDAQDSDIPVITDPALKQLYIERSHVVGHFGAADMARTIRATKNAYWPNMVKDCQKHVSACIPCQRYNIGKLGYHPPKNIQALLPLDHLCIDLKQMPPSMKGNCYYLLVVDVATRFLFLRPLQSKTAYAVAQQLLVLFCDLGFPKILQSDNGTEFVNEIMTALKKIANIDERLISAYNHRSNGIAERAIQSTSQAVYKQVGGLISQWDDYLPAIQHAFNTRVIELHGSSPYALLFGRAPNGFEDFRDTDNSLEKEDDRMQRLTFINSVVFPAIFEKVAKTHTKRKEYFERSHRMLKEDFPAGSQVMVLDEMRTAKHQPKYEGPFTVNRRKPSGNYELRAIDGSTYTRSPWVLKLVAPEIVKGLKLGDTIYAAVNHIVDHREVHGGAIQYRVRWEKTGPEMDTWLFEKDFVDYGPLQKYSKKMGINLRTQKLENKKVEANNSVQKNIVKKVSFSPEITEIAQVETSLARSNNQSDMEKVPMEIKLNDKQKEALGAYWKSTTGSRRVRNPAIVESDSD